MTGGDLRTRYEAEVRALAALGARLRAEGQGPEQVARALHGARLRLSVDYRALTPEPRRSRILARTRAVYGSEEGPTIEALRAAGKSWEEITQGACRPGEAVR
ncbi:hypothetical protein V8J36_07125 [Frigidibacter sp. MR17.14]|uniref:hypothetical protein n=1 Tax=Frigidibacter sp. MR17.14 TaxID=3126509 RepID=UPI003013058E